MWSLLVINFQNYEHVSLIVRSKGGGYVCQYSFQTRPGSRTGSWVLTGSPDRPESIVFLNQNNVVLVKKKNKNQRVATGFLTGSYQVNPPGHTGFFLPLFFLQPGPVPASGRPAGSVFKTMFVSLK